MHKPNIGLIRDGQEQAVLTWHKDDGEGGTIPIAIEFADTLAEEDRQRVEDVCSRPLNIREKGKNTKAFPGSSKHFNALPKTLSRLGYRTRIF